MNLAENLRRADAITQEMLKSAEYQDWDQLAAKEVVRRTLLQTLSSSPTETKALSDEELANTIRGIITNNKKIVTRVQQWQEDVGVLLDAFEAAKDGSG